MVYFYWFSLHEKMIVYVVRVLIAAGIKNQNEQGYFIAYITQIKG